MLLQYVPLHLAIVHKGSKNGRLLTAFRLVWSIWASSYDVRVLVSEQQTALSLKRNTFTCSTSLWSTTNFTPRPVLSTCLLSSHTSGRSIDRFRNTRLAQLISRPL